MKLISPNFNSDKIIQHYPLLGIYLLLVLLTHLPISNLPYNSDDYLQWSALAGVDELYEKGFANVDPSRTVTERVADAYLFMNEGTGDNDYQRDYGNLPWWSASEGVMHPYRPIAALTHWIDYAYLQADRIQLQMHSLVYFLIFAFALYRFYGRFTASPGVLFLASCLVLFDVSMSINYAWLAARNCYMVLALSLFMLIFFMRWRDDVSGEKKSALVNLALALVFWILALMTAEGGVAAGGYLLAYALVLEKKGWKAGILSILPFVVTALIWRLQYNIEGYGAQNIGLYLDPGQNLLEFPIRVLQVLPVIAFSTLLSIDGLIVNLSIGYRDILPWIAFVVMGLVTYFLRHYFMQNKTVQFFILGSILATVPHTALLTAGSRSGSFLAIGFFFVMGLVLCDLLQKNSSTVKKVFAGGVISVHLIIPVVAFSLLSWGVIKVPSGAENIPHHGALQNMGPQSQSLVVVNQHMPSKQFYLPYMWAFNDLPLPKKIQSMAPGLSDITLTRTGERSFNLTADNGFVIHQDVPMPPPVASNTPVIANVYGNRILQGLITNPDENYQVGKIVESAGMVIEITHVQEGLVKAIGLTFTDKEPLESKIWQKYDWQKRQYVVIAVPKIGESLNIPGPFSAL